MNYLAYRPTVMTKYIFLEVIMCCITFDLSVILTVLFMYLKTSCYPYVLRSAYRRILKLMRIEKWLRNCDSEGNTITYFPGWY